jgi:hypothetical protein
MHNFKSRIDHANMTIFFGGVVRMSTHEYVKNLGSQKLHILHFWVYTINIWGHLTAEV